MCTLLYGTTLDLLLPNYPDSLKDWATLQMILLTFLGMAQYQSKLKKIYFLFLN